MYLWFTKVFNANKSFWQVNGSTSLAKKMYSDFELGLNLSGLWLVEKVMVKSSTTVSEERLHAHVRVHL